MPFSDFTTNVPPGLDPNTPWYSERGSTVIEQNTTAIDSQIVTRVSKMEILFGLKAF